MSVLLSRPLDPTPPRPGRPLDRPPHWLTLVVDVEVAHLANPLVAVSRLLASEAEGFARVEGDEQRFTVTVALPDTEPDSTATAEGWIRWAVHNAGIRGSVRRVELGGP